MVPPAKAFLFFFPGRRRYTSFDCDWSSDVCSSDLAHRRSSLSTAAIEKIVAQPECVEAVAAAAMLAVTVRHRIARAQIAGEGVDRPRAVGPHKIGRASCRERV